MKVEQEFFSATQVAKILGVSVDTLRHWRKNKTGLPWYEFHGLIRYRKADIEQLHSKRGNGIDE